MKYLLDTNICIYIIKQKPPQVIGRLQKLEVNEIGISVITLAELEYGVAKSISPERNKLALVKFFAPFEILPFSETAAAVYGRIRSDLEKSGQIIGPYDLLIGAQALSERLTLVTNNEREFQRIPGIIIENWAVL
ncbi:MAG: type II toxin-antitoxin system tRNA(fMet)-specific endonuclease VapC [Bacillota bacterium]